MLAALTCFGRGKRYRETERLSQPAQKPNAREEATADGLSPSSTCRLAKNSVSKGDHASRAKAFVPGLSNALLLENSPLLVTVVSLGPSCRGVVHQNASSKAWLGDLVAPANQQASGDSITGKTSGEKSLSRIFAEDPAKLCELLSDLGAVGHWKGIVRVAAPSAIVVTSPQAPQARGGRAAGVTPRECTPAAPVSTLQADGGADVASGPGHVAAVSSWPPMRPAPEAERADQTTRSACTLTRQPGRTGKKPSCGSELLSTTGHARNSLSLTDLASLRVAPAGATITGRAPVALSQPATTSSAPSSPVRNRQSVRGAAVADSGVVQAEQPPVGRSFLLSTCSWAVVDGGGTDLSLRDLISPTAARTSTASSRSAVFNALRTSTFAMGLLDSSGTSKCVHSGAHDRPAAPARNNLPNSSLTSTISAGRSGGSFTSRAVSFATSLRNAPVMWSASTSGCADAAPAIGAQPAAALPSNTESATERGSAIAEPRGRAATSIPAKMCDADCTAQRTRDFLKQALMEEETTSGSSHKTVNCSSSEWWHEVWATQSVDPLTGEVTIVLMQHDVTGKALVERHLALVMEAGHCLLEQIFPRHVLQHMAERTISSVTDRQAEASQPPLPLATKLKPFDCDEMATWHPQVTLLFADIQGFTPMCNQVEPREVMSMLNKLFSRFDALLDKHGVFKVETIGDCYFVAGGLVQQDKDGMAVVRGADTQEEPLHAQKIFRFAKAMLAAAREVTLPTTGAPVSVRIGLHTGPVVSGVVGTRMPRFCLFGDTVNTTSRMESTGVPGAIHASEATYQLLKEESWTPTGGLEVKGKGMMQTYLWRPQSTDVDDSSPSSSSLVHESGASHIAAFVALRQVAISQGAFNPASRPPIDRTADGTRSAACNLQNILSLESNIADFLLAAGRTHSARNVACEVGSLE